MERNLYTYKKTDYLRTTTYCPQIMDVALDVQADTQSYIHNFSGLVLDFVKSEDVYLHSQSVIPASLVLDSRLYNYNASFHNNYACPCVIPNHKVMRLLTMM